MTEADPIYDLLLLLDPQAEPAARTKIIADARAAVQAQGELLRDDDWGERPLSYPLRRRTSAVYHLLQFHARETALLSGLNRSLHITDGVLRFRIIKLRPGVPAAPDMRAPSGRRPEAEQAPATAPAEAEPATAEPA